MKLSEYFDKVKGLGVLSTADASGKVNSAVYAKPHFIDDDTIAFIMADRLTHANLRSKPNAAYLFKEEGPKYTGKRLYLTRIREEKDSPLIDQLRRKTRLKTEVQSEGVTRYLVYFRVDRVLPLIGDKET